MKKTALLMALGILSVTVTGCVNVETTSANSNGATQWDFDHNVQFKQIKLAKDHFQLEVITNSKVSFDRLATFLIRKSYSICGSYHYKLEMIQGIESFDDKRAMPNYIFPSLIAKVECKPEVKQGKS
ncbi:MAG: hypothetical protein OQK22_13620 [Colwellia sp.]|nr:hypothetical protein [Colwellia sp.]